MIRSQSEPLGDLKGQENSPHICQFVWRNAPKKSHVGPIRLDSDTLQSMVRPSEKQKKKRVLSDTKSF